MSELLSKGRSWLDGLLRRGEQDEQDVGVTTHALTWMTAERSGQSPSARNGHTADLVDSRIFVFGGGDKADLLGDLHVFDVRDHKWSQPPCTGVAPAPRSRHVSAVVDRNLYIWGGIGGGLDVHVLDTHAMDWSTPIVHGAVPDSRFGHTCVVIDGGQPRLFILGGHNSRQALSDVQVLEIGEEELNWRRPSVTGEAPICGNRHAVVKIEDTANPTTSCILVFSADMHDTFGTLYALRYRDGPQGNGLRWVPQNTAGNAPVSRARPSLVLLDQHVFVICGVAAGKPLSTVAMLDVSTYTWSTPSVDGIPPPSRMGLTATRAGTDLYIFGGSDGKVSLRDLHVLVYVTWLTPTCVYTLTRPAPSPAALPASHPSRRLRPAHPPTPTLRPTTAARVCMQVPRPRATRTGRAHVQLRRTEAALAWGGVARRGSQRSLRARPDFTGRATPAWRSGPTADEPLPNRAPS